MVVVGWKRACMQQSKVISGGDGLSGGGIEGKDMREIEVGAANEAIGW